jgi:hypothetical protein
MYQFSEGPAASIFRLCYVVRMFQISWREGRVSSFSQIFAQVYQTTRRHIPEGRNPYFTFPAGSHGCRIQVHGLSKTTVCPFYRVSEHGNSRNIPADGGFLCDKAALLGGGTVKGCFTRITTFTVVGAVDVAQCHSIPITSDKSDDKAKVFTCMALSLYLHQRLSVRLGYDYTWRYIKY